MSEKFYDNVQYVGQELQSALRRLFRRKTGGEPRVSHSHNPSLKTSVVSYCICGVEARIYLSRKPEGYSIAHEVGFEGFKNTEPEATRLKLKRSKRKRLSQRCMDELAQSSLEELKTFYRASKS